MAQLFIIDAPQSSFFNGLKKLEHGACGSTLLVSVNSSRPTLEDLIAKLSIFYMPQKSIFAGPEIGALNQFFLTQSILLDPVNSAGLTLEDLIAKLAFLREHHHHLQRAQRQVKGRKGI